MADIEMSNGKKLDAHEYSNATKQDLVKLFDLLAEVHKECQAKQIPIFVALVDGNLSALSSVSYLPEWEKGDTTAPKFQRLIGSVIQGLRKHLWVHVTFDKYEKPTD